MEVLKPKNHLHYFFIALFVVFAISYFSYLIYLGLTLQIEYYDTFETFVNAKSISTSHSNLYFITRAPLLPLLLAPIFFLRDGFQFIQIAHLTCILFFAGLCYCAFKIWRLELSKAATIICLALFLLNPLILHFAPFSREDLLATVLTTAAFFFYLKSIELDGKRHLFLTGVFAGLAGLTRYNLIPLVPLIILLHYIVSHWKSLTIRPFRVVRAGIFYFIIPLAVIFACPLFLYPMLGRAEFSQAIPIFLSEFIKQTAYHRSYEIEPFQENIVFLLKSFSPPIFLIGLFGIYEVAYRNRKHFLENPRILLFAL